MDHERWERVQTIFEQALELPMEQRLGFLREACAGDDALQATVQGMLDADRKSGDLLLTPGEHAADQLAVGSMLGRFRLERVLGEGGMGRVFEALELGLDRRVALKVLLPSRGLRTSDIQRFEREARAAAKLEHPHIVPVFSVGQERGIHYFSMRLVEGADLRSVLLARRELRTEEPVEVPAFDSDDYIPWVARFLSQVADALQFAHRKKVVHRDVKPGNLMLDVSGSPSLVDFGIMRDEHQGAITHTGENSGSPFYMSPEQAAVSTARVDHRTDIYSAGVVLYELLTMELPYGGETVWEFLVSLGKGSPLPVQERNSRVPRDLGVICSRAMARQVEDRYETAGDLAADLRRFLASEPIRARPISILRRLQLWQRRHRLGVVAGVAVVLAAVSSGLWARHSGEQSRIEGWLEPVRAMQTMESVESASIARLAELKRCIEAIREDEDRLSAQESRQVERSHQLLLQHLEEPQFEASLAASTGPTAVSRNEPLEQARAALRELRREVVLQGEDRSESEILLRNMGTRVRVLPSGLGAGGQGALRIRVRPFQGVAAVPDRQAAWGPIAEEGLLIAGKGHYRFEVSDGAGRTLTFDRLLREGVQGLQLDADFSRWREREPDMVRIDPLPVTYPRESGGLTPLHGVRLELEPYELGIYEVSNAEYLEFVSEYPERRSVLWGPGDYQASWAKLPVVGVAVQDAQAYAEWRGLRLPTAAEIEYAARGTDARRFPWTTDPDPETIYGNVARPWRVEGAEGEDHLANYLLSVVEVQMDPEAASQFGVYHLFGNVAEMTGTPAYGPGPNQSWVPMEGASAVLGGAWDVRKEAPDFPTTHSVQFNARHSASPQRGFRCARSVD